MLMLAAVCAVLAAVFAPSALAQDEREDRGPRSETTGILKYEKITLQEGEEIESGATEIDRETVEVVPVEEPTEEPADESAELPSTGGLPLSLLAVAGLLIAGGLVGLAVSGRTGAYRLRS